MIKTGKELAAACEAVAKNYKTLYVNGCFGAPMSESNKNRYTKNTTYNKKPERTAKIRAATADTFGFDCVCFIKGLLWGWDGNASHIYGGAVYASRGVPDIGEGQMIDACSEVSKDFTSIVVGEVVWMPGHIGVYIGNGLAAECTPAWMDGVQITAVHNIGKQPAYNGRFWVKHGKLPYLTYEAAPEIPEAIKPEAPAGTYTLQLTELRKGAKGEAVEALQMLLIAHGFDCGRYGVDGDFGSATDKAVRTYQESTGLTADGIAGKNTMSSLLGL